jgi:hypothetical protein
MGIAISNALKGQYKDRIMLPFQGDNISLAIHQTTGRCPGLSYTGLSGRRSDFQSQIYAQGRRRDAKKKFKKLYLRYKLTVYATGGLQDWFYMYYPVDL